jgi:hypothetical protein
VSLAGGLHRSVGRVEEGGAVSDTVSKSEVVKASELREKVFRPIFDRRNPDAMPAYRKELAKYRRRLGKRQQVRVKTGFFGEYEKTGFQVEVMGAEAFIERPRSPQPIPYSYHGYDRFMGHASHARESGLLASPQLNRDIRPQRVDAYADEMRAGRWRSLLSDPIAITEEGHVINGQHRLAAASKVDWSEVENDPEFLVIWGVDPLEATLADGSRRTDRDERTIATRVADVAAHSLEAMRREQARGAEAGGESS